MRFVKHRYKGGPSVFLTCEKALLSQTSGCSLDVSNNRVDWVVSPFEHSGISTASSEVDADFEGA